MKTKKEGHRKGLIEIYESMVKNEGVFMKTVLTEALRKLKETDIHPRKIENWVVDLERLWRKTNF